MWIPNDYNVENPEKQIELIRENSLGLIITQSSETGLNANHIPFIADVEDGKLQKLRAHFARKNPMTDDVKHGAEVLVVFQRHDAYVSPSYYKDTKPNSGKVVPTWDYATVHVRGKAKMITDGDWIRGQIDELAHVHESKRDHEWKLSDAPENYTKLLQKNIWGLEIEVTDVKGKWKMSQEKKNGDNTGVSEGFKADFGAKGHAMAEEVEQLATTKNWSN